MAFLANDTASLRLQVQLVQRELTRGAALPGRVLAVAGLEYLDRKDGEHWPVVRLPPLWLLSDAVDALLEGVQRLARGEAAGFSWQSGGDGAVGLQVGQPQGEAGPLLVEVGLDLSGFLADVAEVPARPGAELALFRFASTRAALVAFGDGLRTELEALAP